MPQSFTEYGLAGLLILLTFTHVIKPLIAEKKRAASGEMSMEFWQSKIREITREAIDDKMAPVMARQTEILGKIEMNQEAIARSLTRLLDRLELKD